MDNEIAYFSVYRALGSASVNDGRYIHYGPVPAARSTEGAQEPTYVVPKSALMEWAQQEMESEPNRRYFWNRTREWLKPERDDDDDEDDDVRVTFSNGGAGELTVRFGRDECLNVSRSWGVEESIRGDINMTVDRGGCALAFDDDRCAGEAPRMIVQEPAGLYAIGGRRAAGTITAGNVGSLTGCGRRELHLKPEQERTRPIPKELFVDPVFLCSCGSVDRTPDDSPRPPQRRAVPETGSRLSELNAAAGAAMRLAREAAVSVATRRTSSGRRASANAAVESLRTVVETGNRYVRGAAGLLEPRELSDLDRAVRLADRTVRLAEAATPETATTLIMWAVRFTGNVSELVARSHGGLGNGTGERPRGRGRRSADRGPRPGNGSGSASRDERPPEDDPEGWTGRDERPENDSEGWTGRDKTVVVPWTVVGVIRTCFWSRSDGRWACDTTRRVVETVSPITAYRHHNYLLMANVVLLTLVLLLMWPRVADGIRRLFAPRDLAFICYKPNAPSSADVEPQLRQP